MLNFIWIKLYIFADEYTYILNLKFKLSEIIYNQYNFFITDIVNCKGVGGRKI